MKKPREVEEVKDVREVKENKKKCANIAAFFDLDGTLVALPSLERRFFRALRYRRAIPMENYFLWLREALRLMPHGIAAMMQANKMYLRGIQSLDERGGRGGSVSSWHKSGHQGEGQASDHSLERAPKRARRNPRLPVPAFFAEAIERMAWHARQGHAIVLMSGTLEPLARDAARAMEAELAVRGIAVRICVCATRLEEVGGRWTGRVLGEAMFGEAKARAVKGLASEMNLDLAQCFAYGDSLQDRALLAAVGRPAAVNPSRRLSRIASTLGWPILCWKPEKKMTTQRRPDQIGAGAGRRENGERRYKAIPMPRTEELRRSEAAITSSENIG